MQAAQFGISEMADIYGVSLRTLRFYEDRGLLTPTRVGQSRLYSPKDRIRLELILKGKRLGFSLREIEELIVANTPRSQPTIDETADIMTKLDARMVERQLETLQRQREELDVAIGELREALQIIDGRTRIAGQ